MFYQLKRIKGAGKICYKLKRIKGAGCVCGRKQGAVHGVGKEANKQIHQKPQNYLDHVFREVLVPPDASDAHKQHVPPRGALGKAFRALHTVPKQLAGVVSRSAGGVRARAGKSLLV